MDTVTLEVAKHLTRACSINRATIVWMPEQLKWKIIFHGIGDQDYDLLSFRKKIRQFGNIESALTVVHDCGLRGSEIDSREWCGK